mmetsp:Transcript_45137/g.54268  ORF Transcript_45137/g.54268 Transcript_45137/m.54268 type:complete len:215 (-) Transcript_45137:1059-1703(-)
MMKNFTYDLNINSIAKYPASPRGSSRLVRVDGEGSVSHYKNFSEAFVSLAKKGSHVVFNQSKVVNARLSVKEGEKGNNSGIEMMILDLGECIDELCNDVKLTVMIRKEEVSVGDIFTEETCGTGTFIVVDVICPWIEDEKVMGMVLNVSCNVQSLTIRTSLLRTFWMEWEQFQSHPISTEVLITVIFRPTITYMHLEMGRLQHQQRGCTLQMNS